MPCHDNRDWTPDYRADAETYKAQAKVYKDRCDELARLLCKVCQQEADGTGVLADPDLASWWETHQAQDRVNAQIERMRAKS